MPEVSLPLSSFLKVGIRKFIGSLGIWLYHVDFDVAFPFWYSLIQPSVLISKDWRWLLEAYCFGQALPGAKTPVQLFQFTLVLCLTRRLATRSLIMNLFPKPVPMLLWRLYLSPLLLRQSWDPQKGPVLVSRTLLQCSVHFLWPNSVLSLPHALLKARGIPPKGQCSKQTLVLATE